MPFYRFATEEPCQACGLFGRLEGAVHYDRNVLDSCSADFYCTRENNCINRWYASRLVVSRRFRDRLIENTITRDVRNMYANTYGPKDFF